ncbi:tumor necrosis factor ligand superfamily member 11 [Brachyhypopomus gauderio]|uniref:tumor necrosis factor ligand superfamily member 11 n=1 Tax=Brachyhypopomus gauderio TaxID=698409 RepID=UPI004043601D
MAANYCRGYLRNHMDMENGQARSHPAQSPHRTLVFGVLALLALLQVASTVTILLHLTGYLREVDMSSVQPAEEVHSEPIIADALRDPQIKERWRKRDATPVAHLSVRTPIDFSSTDPTVVTTVHWDELRSTLIKFKYHNGRLLMEEQGLYYVYAKTCFRYAADHVSNRQDVSNAQLIQYIYHEINSQSKFGPVLLSKSGGTLQWSHRNYHMYCVQQGRSVRLRKSDSLFVNVSNSWLLDPEPEGTYFGAFKMSN